MVMSHSAQVSTLHRLLQVSTSSNHRSRPAHMRRRGFGDTGRSFSYHAPSSHGRGDLMFVGSPPRAYKSTKTSRCPSRTSMEPHSPGTTSPPVSPLATTSSSGVAHHCPAKSPSSGSLTKFHNKVMDKLKTVLHLKNNQQEEEEQEGSRGQS
ncbi:hypothetical protein GWK47_026096 [Chionoecetes opilio]|uniref:Uncharacterized protein n=1 Tax=Chionoecetes opilio TaxID=41210 RepID=A0A8J8WFQ2_CHIOP|nr:hypothetical protein GWK47_026096 [Chionoecetes opilio]